MIESDWVAVAAIAQQVLTAHDRVAPIRAFLAAGLTRHQVAALYRQGVLKRPRIGWYADPTLPNDAIRAIRVGGVLGGVSAAKDWGLPIPENAGEGLVVSLTDNASRLRHSRDRTWQTRAGDEEGVELVWHERVAAVAGYRVALVDALLQLATCVPFDWLVAALDRALHAPRGEYPMLTPAALDLLRSTLPRRLRSACDLADGRAESPIETLLRLALGRAGIPVEIQAWIVPWYRVDFLIDGWLVVEADGMGKFSSDQYGADRERDAQLAVWGYMTLRFTYRQIVEELPWVLEVIAAVRSQRRAA